MENQILYKTDSLCPECLDKISAEYRVVDDKVYLCKECKKHGEYKTLFWNDAELFKKWADQSVHADKFLSGTKIEKECPFDCGLCEEHEGGVCTAVLEITYRCNLNCNICFAETDKALYEPSIEEIKRMYETAMKLGGNCSIQLSGGEPTVREDLAQIIQIGKSMGFSHIQVNTNGLKLASDSNYAKQLAQAGADLIYLQFDGTDDNTYTKIRNRKLLDIKIKAIFNCGEANLGVLLVPTIIPNINLNDIGNIVSFAKSNMPIVKGVHFQPVSYFGRYIDNMQSDMYRCSLSDIMHCLERQTNNEIKIRNLVPRKRYDAHCAFSSLYFLNEEGILKAISEEDQKLSKTGSIDFAKKTNEFTNLHWRMNTTEKKQNLTNSQISKFVKRLKEYTLTITGMGFQDVWNIDIKRLKGCCVHVISGSQAVPLCAFHLTSSSGKRLYKNE